MKIGKSIYSSDMDIQYTTDEYIKHQNRLKKKILPNGLFPFDKNNLVKYSDEFVKMSILGEQLKNKFLSGTEGFIELMASLDSQYVNNKGYIQSLDDRYIFCESKHKVLNSLLQSSGAIFMKYYLVEVYNLLAKDYRLDIDYSFICNIHDAIVIRTTLDKQEEIGVRMEQAFTNVSNKFGFLHAVKGKAILGYNLYDIFI